MHGNYNSYISYRIYLHPPKFDISMDHIGNNSNVAGSVSSNEHAKTIEQQINSLEISEPNDVIAKLQSHMQNVLEFEDLYSTKHTNISRLNETIKGVAVLGQAKRNDKKSSLRQHMNKAVWFNAVITESLGFYSQTDLKFI